MVFSSAIFLFAFLPIVLLLYCLSGQRLKNGILLAASLLFYAYGEPKFVFVMLASIVLNYAFAMLIELARLWVKTLAQGLAAGGADV